MSDQPVYNQLSEAPLTELVTALATGLMEAQLELDLLSTRIAEMMSGSYQENDKTIDTRVTFGGEPLSLMELGFTPTFYQFVEMTFELKVSVSISRSRSQSVTKKKKVITKRTKRYGLFGTGGSKTTTRITSVNTHVASRYQYHAEASSLLRAKIVPIPPSSLLLERMEALRREILADEKSVIERDF